MKVQSLGWALLSSQTTRKRHVGGWERATVGGLLGYVEREWSSRTTRITQKGVESRARSGWQEAGKCIPCSRTLIYTHLRAGCVHGRTNNDARCQLCSTMQLGREPGAEAWENKAWALSSCASRAAVIGGTRRRNAVVRPRFHCSRILGNDICPNFTWLSGGQTVRNSARCGETRPPASSACGVRGWHQVLGWVHPEDFTGFA